MTPRDVTIEAFAAGVMSLSISCNKNKEVYESAEVYIEGLEEIGFLESADLSDDLRQRMIDTDTVWEVRWYPRTPVGSHTVFGATFEEAWAEAVSVWLEERKA